ncbi:MAG: hypothetical protein J0L84_00475 [Verrucomicrobia bacterium]|nr:hypothetical protein [Verrucomicrobiota bacterium]
MRIPPVLLAVVTLVVVAGAVSLGLAARLLKTRTVGQPHGRAARAGDQIAVLIETQEPYVPSLRRDPSSDRYRLDLLLLPTGEGGARRMVRLADGLRAGGALQSAGIPGVDGDTVWLRTPELQAYRLQSRKLVGTVELRRLSPDFADLFSDGLIEFNGHLQLVLQDLRRACELDAETLKARAIEAPRRRGLPPAEDAAAGLCTGGLWSSNRWWGALSSREQHQDFRPGMRLPRDASFTPSREPRRLYHAVLDGDGTHARIQSIELLPGDEHPDLGCIRSAPGAGLLQLQDPAGTMVCFRSGSQSGGTWVLQRLDWNGRVLWTTDTGMGDLDQVLPDPRRPAFLGRKPRVPDTLQEPVLVVVHGATGAASTTSLWVPDR